MIAGIEREGDAIKHNHHGRIGLPPERESYHRRPRRDRNGEGAPGESGRASEDACLDALSGFSQKVGRDVEQFTFFENPRVSHGVFDRRDPECSPIAPQKTAGDHVGAAARAR